MIKNTDKNYLTRIKAAAAILLTLLLVACGGGGGGTTNSCVAIDPLRSSALPGCPVTGTSTGGGSGATVALAPLAVSLVDGTGTAITTISPEVAGMVRAVAKDGTGAVLPNIAVTFTTTDKTGSFIPASGTALTDSNGIAKLGLPAGTQAGAFTVTASAAVGSTVATGSASYSVTFASVTLSSLSIAPSTLSAGGNASIGVTVLNGNALYAPTLAVTFTSPCAIAGKAIIGSPVLTQNGTATASYTDKGCGVPDVITASVNIGGGASKTGTINVLPAAAGSIKFVTASTTNIALKGTGGFGRQEFSTLTFQVFDTTGTAISGRTIDFAFADVNPAGGATSNTTTTTGGLTLNPASATSAADGTVTTQVSAGTIPTSVRVVASVHGSQPLVTTLSNILVISTGVPDQRHFSLSSSNGNCEGRDIDQTCSFVTVRMGDHFGNPVPDGTAVNFTAQGGIIGASCVTGSLPPPGATPAGQTTNSSVGPGSGSCTVEMDSAAPRPTTGPGFSNGRYTVLAYALGEEDFSDTNGNNVYDASEPFTDKSPDIFRDDNKNGIWNSGEPCIGPNTNGTCSTPGDGQYNGVLRNPQVASAQTQYISAQYVQVFSGSTAVITFNPATPTCPAGGSTDIQVLIGDIAGNIMPSGSDVAFSSLFAGNPTVVVPSAIKVPNVVLGVMQNPIVPFYTVTVACPAAGGSGKLFVTVTTPSGVISTNSVNIN